MHMKTKTPVQMDDGIGDDLDTSLRPDVAGLKDKPTHDEIARVAFQIYQMEGCPTDRADTHWIEAERHLKAGTVDLVLR